MFLIKVKRRRSQVYGTGIFTLEAMKKGAEVFITQDSWPVRTKLVCARSYFSGLPRSIQRYIEHFGYLAPEFFSNFYKADLTDVRFINDAVGCEANIILETAPKDAYGIEKCVVVAKRDIAAGEELIQDYADFADPTWLAEKRQTYRRKQ